MSLHWTPREDNFRWLPNEQEIREGLFIAAWPLRAAIAILALTFGVCLLPGAGLWEMCKRDAKGLLRFTLEGRDGAD